MLSGSVVAIDPGSQSTRVVWLKGSAGGLQVERAESYVVGQSNSSLEEIVADLKGKKVPISGLRLGAPGRTATLRYNLLPPVPDWRLELILKYEEAESAVKRHPDLIGYLPEKKRRFFETEPRNMIVFDALALAEEVINGPPDKLAAAMG